ncbi:uncharacterized protein LOC123896473 [Trifolium pratense]|uniref:uncharacterized protein LOC123896473 n=1 Tax=Trifolium pratense TaxID=57577 RepID=UPI001E69056E|nr:uncharacterized protein LOC123896473 [Trifolium pratense]
MNSHLSMFIFLITLLTISSFSSSQPSYKDHCSSIITESTPKNLIIHNSFPLGGYFTGGSGIIHDETSFIEYSSFYLSNIQIHETINTDLFKVESTVSFRTKPNTVYYNVSSFSYGDKPSYRSQRHFRSNYVTFKLEGFWSKSSGKVCMVGTGISYSETGDSLDHDAVLKLNNVFDSSNITSFISGSLESLNSEKGDEKNHYFETISLMMFSKANYSYSLDSKEVENEFSFESEVSEKKGLSLNPYSSSFCSLPLSRALKRLQLEYTHECNSPKNCSPVVSDQLPYMMSLKGAECSHTDKHRLKVLMVFSNKSDYWIEKGFNPKTMLIGEGWWDEKKNALHVVACHFIGIMKSSWDGTRIGDCSVRLRLSLPSVWSIENTNNIVGKIWSNKTANDPNYFKMITFRIFDDARVGYRASKYEYSKLEKVKKSCPTHKVVENKGRTIFPNVYSYDMRFGMSVRDIESNIEVAFGSLAPLSVGEQIYDDPAYTSNSNFTAESPMVMFNNASLFNISYKITIFSNATLYNRNSMFNLSSYRVTISAEGIYDARTGTLCMIGCRNLNSKAGTPLAGSVDCEILLKFQFPSLDTTNGSHIKGSIESMREKSDHLYFKSLEVSSYGIYSETAIKAVWRMDMEIIMVLISTSLSCVFIALQLYHVKRNPNALPLISISMMSILTLGHMIPLVLNFEATLAQDLYNKNFVVGYVGWLEVNEISVRIITMVAFLLQFLLLQVTWSSRKINESENRLWIAERKATYVTFPLYAAGLLISLLLKLKRDDFHYDTSWEKMKSYGGLVLDGFLLPQVILNLFSNMNENVLSCSFYFGTTFVRLLPHAYDLYRAHNYARLSDGSYFYANPNADFYSTTWDIVIPLGGILFAVIIYLQQRFGAQCVIPQRFKGSEYEKVSVVAESEA